MLCTYITFIINKKDKHKRNGEAVERKGRLLCWRLIFFY